MSNLSQDLITAAIVLLSLLIFVRHFCRRALQGLSHRMAALGGPIGVLGRWLQRRRPAATCQDGGCSSCGGCAAPAPPTNDTLIAVDRAS